MAFLGACKKGNNSFTVLLEDSPEFLVSFDDTWLDLAQNWGGHDISYLHVWLKSWPSPLGSGPCQGATSVSARPWDGSNTVRQLFPNSQVPMLSEDKPSPPCVRSPWSRSHYLVYIAIKVIYIFIFYIFDPYFNMTKNVVTFMLHSLRTEYNTITIQGSCGTLPF